MITIEGDDNDFIKHDFNDNHKNVKKVKTAVPIKHKNFNIICSNICGWTSKKHSFQNILLKQKADAAFVCETHFQGDQIPEAKGYVSYFRNRPKKSKGGICLLLKREYESFAIKMNQGDGDNEFLIVKLSCFDPEVILILVYGVIENQFSKHDYMKLQSEVFNEVKEYTEKGYTVFWGGDMNVHLGNTLKGLESNHPDVSQGGANLLRFIEQENLFLCNTKDSKHTHLDRSNKTSKILDLMVTNNPEAVTKFEVDPDLDATPYRHKTIKKIVTKKYTDHLTLIINTKLVDKGKHQSNKLTGWNYFKEGGDERYIRETNDAALEILTKVDTVEDINEVYNFILKTIDNIKRRVYGKTTITAKKDEEISEYAIWKSRIKEVENCLKGLKKKKPVDRVWELRKKTSFKFKDKQFCAIRDPETGKLSTSRDETYQILLKYNKELLRKDKVQKSEKIKQEEERKQRITESALRGETWEQDEELDEKDYKEVLDKIRTDNKKVYRDLIKAGNVFQYAVFQFYKRLYKEEVQPEDFYRTHLMKLWKKKGSRNDVKMHRFIHLKSWGPKCYEALVMKKFSKRLMAKTPEFQIGGKKTYSTTEHLISLMMIMQRLDKEKGGGICMFVDVKTCFDVLQLSDALYECAKAGVIGKPLRVIKAYTEKVIISLEGDEDASRLVELMNCLGQGTCFAPLGTGLTISSTLEEKMAEEEVERLFDNPDFSLTPQVGPLTLHPIMFVDDIAKPAEGAEESKVMGVAVTNTLDDLKMEAHPDKSCLLVFGRKREKIKEEVEDNPTYIQGFKVGIKSEETYLGMQIDEGGWSASISATLEKRKIKCTVQAMDLKKKLEDDRVLATGWLQTAITVFNASIVSILTYGCGAWLNLNKTQEKKIEAIQRQSLYTVLDISNKCSYLNVLAICRIMPANDMVKKLKICFINELLHVKKEGICYEALMGEYNKGEIKTLIDEVKEYCEYFEIEDVTELYQDPKWLKKKIWTSSMNKLWWALLKSKKAPFHIRNLEEKRQFYFTLPKHQAKIALYYDIGELNLRSNRRHESCKKYGGIQCVVPGCVEDDTLKHLQECHGYSSKFVDDGLPETWIKYLCQIDRERFQKYKTSLIDFRT